MLVPIVGTNFSMRDLYHDNAVTNHSKIQLKMCQLKIISYLLPCKWWGSMIWVKLIMALSKVTSRGQAWFICFWSFFDQQLPKTCSLSKKQAHRGTNPNMQPHALFTSMGWESILYLDWGKEKEEKEHLIKSRPNNYIIATLLMLLQVFLNIFFPVGWNISQNIITFYVISAQNLTLLKS